uniref:tRNA(Ile)-lysidine synthase n=1 Tax=Cumathamnion serrulatum TaxID=1206573 RepID=A0A7U1G3T1_9FLOR|nr:tRNA-Ile-lysidine synthetase [Cumathamnion serrulatum]QQY85279.1 tRNA-Ile-lysidine synthetase [Cumathamnion serrulatum]
MRNDINQYFNKTIKVIIKKYRINSILIAISGGQDSICLLNLIEHLEKENIFIKKIAYIYVDHQWKIDSEKQIEHIINYLKYKKKKIYIYQIKEAALSENISRIHRYHIIIHHAIQYKFKAIITAHTKTDKIETFLQNLIRRTSIEGATGLNLHRRLCKNINIFRPLISISRIEINFFCRQYYLPVWSDITNYNYHIQRNRIRNELIPYLKKYINQKAEHNITHFLKTCYYDHEYIKQKVIKLYINNKDKNCIALNYQLIKQKHISIQTRIIQLFIYHNFYLLINHNSLIKIINKMNQKDKNMQSIVRWKHITIYIKKNVDIYKIKKLIK